MTEFDNLKNSYITTVQCAMAMGAGCQQAKHGNDVLHRLCEILVDHSNYSDADKQAMKQYLEMTKETLGCEIDVFYENGQV